MYSWGGVSSIRDRATVQAFLHKHFFRSLLCPSLPSVNAVCTRFLWQLCKWKYYNQWIQQNIRFSAKKCIQSDCSIQGLSVQCSVSHIINTINGCRVQTASLLICWGHHIFNFGISYFRAGIGRYQYRNGI